MASVVSIKVKYFALDTSHTNPLRFSPNLLCHCLALRLYDEIIFNWDAFSWGMKLNPDWLSEGRNLRCFQYQSFTCYNYTARAAWIQMGALGGHQQAHTIWLPHDWPSRKRYCIWSVCSLPGCQPVPHAQLFFNHPHTLSRRKFLDQNPMRWCVAQNSTASKMVCLDIKL